MKTQFFVPPAHAASPLLLWVDSSRNRQTAPRAPRRSALLAVLLVLVPVGELGFCTASAWAQFPQYQSSQYIQQAPNYIQYQQPQGYGQQQYPQRQQYPQPQQQPQQQQYAQPQYAQPSYADPGQDAPQGAYAAPAPGGQPFGPVQLEQLVAPIALYPDSLVAQILAASTYPAQVIAADNWLHSQAFASPDQVAYGANMQTNWDPSVKGLTAFPLVLDLMNRDLRWTTDLGNAYYNQPQDVLQTIQVMRGRAQDAGTLQNTPQQAVSYDQGYIQLTPASSQQVYVPTYNPWTSYGQQVSPYPGFSLVGALQSFGSSGLFQTGLSFAMSAFSHTPFGIAGWALNWLTSSVLFNHSPYSSQSTSVAHWGNSGGGYYGSRGGGINRTPNGWGGSQFGSQRGSNRFGNQGQGYNRPGGTPERAFAGNYERPAQPQNNWNRQQTQPVLPARPQPQSYGRSNGYGYGSGYNTMTPQAYAQRQPATYAGQQAWRAPVSSYQRNDFAQHSYAEPRSFSGNRGYTQAYANEGRSGGSHVFGGGHGEENYHSSYKEPKFKAPREFKAPKAPKMSGGHGGGGHGGGGHGGGLFGHGHR
jgi:hypothetical protein